MTTQTDNSEIVLEGWLTKSPPSTRIWRARWRRRWFILRHSGELPGQYFLCYYTDRNCRKLKGQIDLDQCEQIDAGLRFENRKQKYQHMFNIRTPKRTYYLAAESEEDMNKWVDSVCHVCGLKPFISDDSLTECDGDDVSQAMTGITDLSPPVTPSTVITGGPYIPISECISGQPIVSAEDMKQFLLSHARPRLPLQDGEDSYDSPRNLKHPIEADVTPPPSPGSESVFTDDESIVESAKVAAMKPAVNWDTFPKPSESSVDGEEEAEDTLKANRRFTKVIDAETIAPPRPPKPAHLLPNEETEEKSEEIINDVEIETYDIPRSHQINRADERGEFYTNAVPTENVFRYDFPVEKRAVAVKGDAAYTNLLGVDSPPSPKPVTPPAINRELKPGRKDSSTGSNEPSPNGSVGSYHPPNVDRNLKPATQSKRMHDSSRANDAIRLCSPPIGSLDRRKLRMAPIVTTTMKATDGFSATMECIRKHFPSNDTLTDETDRGQFYHIDDHQVLHGKNLCYGGGVGGGGRLDKVQYLDLDLKANEEEADDEGTMERKRKQGGNACGGSGGGGGDGGVGRGAASTATVYKTVDFFKTEAFNRTRIEIEEERHNRMMRLTAAVKGS